jgi:hypothetical protein
VPLDDESKPKTAFRDGGRHYQSRRMAQSLSNAPATFQCLFIKVLISMLFSNEFVYIDDVLLMVNNF